MKIFWKALPNFGNVVGSLEDDGKSMYYLALSADVDYKTASTQVILGKGEWNSRCCIWEVTCCCAHAHGSCCQNMREYNPLTIDLSRSGRDYCVRVGSTNTLAEAQQYLADLYACRNKGIKVWNHLWWDSKGIFEETVDWGLIRGEKMYYRHLSKHHSGAGVTAYPDDACKLTLGEAIHAAEEEKQQQVARLQHEISNLIALEIKVQGAMGE